MQIVLARLCYINKILINTNEADAQIRELSSFLFHASRLPAIPDGRIYARSSWTAVCKYDVLLILLRSFIMYEEVMCTIVIRRTTELEKINGSFNVRVQIVIYHRKSESLI